MQIEKTKTIFYIVTTICVLITLSVMLFNWLTFRWWFVGYKSNILHHIIGTIIFFMPATTLAASFFIKKKEFFTVFAIINGILIPIVFILGFLPYT